MTKMHVIYVDDEQTALENFRCTMENFGGIYHLALFQTTEAALDYVKSNSVDMAFLDVDLGVVSGFQLFAQLKAICPDLPISFVTANIRYMRKANQIVKAPYIFKPYNREDILAVLPAD